ncbi:MAG: DUF4982 domain-containing protein, partial [Chitinivibrionales bacterium]|nr:DUF4982 domain-containing protein [Chitinivibrionales bacterium]
DFKSPKRDDNPLPCQNQKGLFLYDHTTPKDVAYFYRSYYVDGSDDPMVYIVSHTWLDRWTQPEAKPVWVYSNCDSVELFNDYGVTSFGKRARTAGERGDTRFKWDDPYVQYNVLYARGYIDGRVAAEDYIVLENLPAPPTGTSAEKVDNIQAFSSGLSILSSNRIAVTVDKESKISVDLYSADGTLVSRVVNRSVGRGVHSWSLNGMLSGAGVYYVVARVGDTRLVGKIPAGF